MENAESQSAKSHISTWLSNQSNELICEIQICVSLLFFGISFVCQKQAMINGMSPVTYNACRYLVSTFVLYALKECSGLALQIDTVDEVSTASSSAKYQEIGDEEENDSLMENPQGAQQHASSFFNSLHWRAYQIYYLAVLMGIFNYGGSILQQIGLVTVTAGKTGFITGMFVVFVPLFEYCLIPKYRHHMTYKLVLAVLMSLVGLYVLSGCLEQEVCIGGAIKEGEVIVFISMLFWVGNLLVADHGAKNVEVISLTYYEFILTTILTFATAFYYESYNFAYPFTSITDNWHLIIIVGITEALAFALSTLGQMYTPPTRAAVLFSMESVVCAVLAYFILKETLTAVEIGGAVLMVLAALISSLSEVQDVVQEVEEEEATERLIEKARKEKRREEQTEEIGEAGVVAGNGDYYQLSHNNQTPTGSSLHHHESIIKESSSYRYQDNNIIMQSPDEESKSQKYRTHRKASNE